MMRTGKRPSLYPSTMRDLIRKYSHLNDELLNYTDEHYDNCLYDIEGYSIEGGDYMKELKGRVNAIEKLVEAYKLLESNPTLFA